MNRRTLVKAALAGMAATAMHAGSAWAENPVLKIGFVGVTSGPSAAWGISNQRSMETRAAWINETGGYTIGGTTYDIEIVPFDDEKKPDRAVEGMKKMKAEGIRYVVGPNVDDVAAAVRPIAEDGNIMYFPYAFPKSLYRAPASNAVLGMVANYQSGPAIYRHLMKENGIRRIAFLAADQSDPLSQRAGGVAAAKALGLDVVSDNVTFSSDTTDFSSVLPPVLRVKPDLIVLSGVLPAHAGKIIRTARELGYEGLLSTETAQDAAVLQKEAGNLANGFISVGGASTPELASGMMREFVARYKAMFGEYNDESNTKVYALEYILETLKANPQGLNDIKAFQKTMETFEAPNPYMNGDAKLRYVGMSSFGQKRQLAVPLVVNVYQNGNFKTLFVAEVD